MSRPFARVIWLSAGVASLACGPTGDPPPSIPVASVTVSPGTASVAVGATTPLAATTYDAEGNVLTGRAISWASDNTGIATVTGSGVVRGMTAGNTTVRATSEGQSGSADIEVTGGGGGSNFAMRFYGNTQNDVGRVKIPLDNPARPVDVGGTFTIEFWVRGRIQDNGQPATTCGDGVDAWIEGNILLDRDRFTAPRDYGLAFLAGRVAFGVRNAADAVYTICGATSVLNDQWHHVAVTRNSSSGALVIFVDGVSNASATGPVGDISYPDGVVTNSENDPFLVIGAEKHNIPSVPGFNGFTDELRISTTIRYPGTTTFTPPSTRFSADGNTAALYHFDEGSGTVLVDAVGSSPGEVRVGGVPAGPAWVVSTAPTD